MEPILDRQSTYISTGQNLPIVQSGRLQTIKTFAKDLFNSIVTVCCFPLRFFGSKTWSIPGVIFSIPGIIYQRVILGNRTKSLSEELFGSGNGYQYHLDRELTLQEANEFHPAVCMTALMYMNKDFWLDRRILPERQGIGYKLIQPSSLNLDLKQISPTLECHPMCFFDMETGLKVAVAYKDNKVIIAFGGADHRTEIKASVYWSWKFNITSTWCNLFFGGKPTIYRQAAAIVNMIKSHPDMQGKEILISGLSLGGAIAAYAGIQTQTPTVCFNSCQLGVGLQEEIGKEKLSTADRFVTHLTTRGDWLTNPFPGAGYIDRIINLFGIKTAGNFGKYRHMDAIYYRWQLAASHGRVLECQERHILAKGG